MANLAGNVRVGSPDMSLAGTKGYALFAPIGTKLPTTLAEAFEDGWQGVGLISEDGVTRDAETTKEEVRDWNKDVVRELVTEVNASYSFRLIQDDITTARLLFGAENVVEGTDGEYTINYTGDPLPHMSFAFLMKDGTGMARHIIGDGQLSVDGSAEFSKGAWRVLSDHNPEPRQEQGPFEQGVTMC